MIREALDIAFLALAIATSIAAIRSCYRSWKRQQDAMTADERYEDWEWNIGI